jgi:hypothetical protein
MTAFVGNRIAPEALDEGKYSVANVITTYYKKLKGSLNWDPKRTGILKKFI